MSARQAKVEERFKNCEPLKLLSSVEFDQHCLDYKDYMFKKHGCLMRFFDKKLSRWVNKYKIPILVISFTWMFYSMY
jgi:hypothetical protein